MFSVLVALVNHVLNWSSGADTFIHLTSSGRCKIRSQFEIFNFWWSFDRFEKQEVKNATHKDWKIENDRCDGHNDRFCSFRKLKEEIFLWPAIGCCTWNEVCQHWDHNDHKWCKDSWQGEFLQLANIRPSFVDPFWLWDLFDIKIVVNVQYVGAKDLEKVLPAKFVNWISLKQAKLQPIICGQLEWILVTTVNRKTVC